VARKITRLADFKQLPRKAQDALYPNPPEPESEILTDATDSGPAEPEPPVGDEARKSMLGILGEHYGATRNTAPGLATTDRRRLGYVSSVKLRGRALLRAADDPAVMADLAEQVEMIRSSTTIGKNSLDHTMKLVELKKTDSTFCQHGGKRPAGSTHPCLCESFCVCRMKGVCNYKYNYRFIEPAKLLRLWSQDMFDITTFEVAALLTVDEHLAVHTVGWARRYHYAWSVKHDAALIQLEEHHRRES